MQTRQVTLNLMRFKFKSILACCLLSLVTTSELAGAREISATGPEAMTKQAIDLFKQGMLDDALAAQKKAVAENPSSSLAHASMSYLAWKQGDALGAINEGETAVKLESDRVVYLINLALMMQDSEGYPEAITLYSRAHQLAPDSWVPPLGLARCDILTGHQDKGNAALRAMAQQSERSFEWYYMTAKTAIENQQLDTALTAINKAMILAKTEPEKRAASAVALLAALRGQDLPRAHALLNASLTGSAPKTGEIYVRAASVLLSVNEPKEGSKLLNCALENLKTVEDSETFLKLGQLFEEKAQSSAADSKVRQAWFDNARAAYSNASVLRPNAPVYHLTLAGALYRMGLYSEAAAEFNKTSQLDKTELLASFLASKLLAAKSADGKQPKLTLSLVHFNIIGLSCGCKLARLRLTLRESGVVVFVNTNQEKPYVGQILVDQSVPVEELLHQVEGIAIPHAPTDTTPPDNLKLEITTKAPVTSIDDVIKISEGVTLGPIMVFGNTYADFVNRYKEVRPVIPVSDLSTESDIKDGTAWRIAL